MKIPVHNYMSGAFSSIMKPFLDEVKIQVQKLISGL